MAKMINNKLALLGLSAALMGLSACSMRTVTLRDTVATTGEVQTVAQEKAPGTVQYIWEEPMVDAVDVPPGLDPEGHYYRPSHQEIVEIRQGRWKYYKD